MTFIFLLLKQTKQTKNLIKGFKSVFHKEYLWPAYKSNWKKNWAKNVQNFSTYTRVYTVFVSVLKNKIMDYLHYSTLVTNVYLKSNFFANSLSPKNTRYLKYNQLSFVHRRQSINVHKTILRLTPGVNFSKILWAAFLCKSYTRGSFVHEVFAWYFFA